MLPENENVNINARVVAEPSMEAARGFGQLGVMALFLESQGSVVSALLVDPGVLSGRI